MAETETTKSLCTKCKKETNHDVLARHNVPGPEEYHCMMEYMIVRCRGCDDVSFRYVFNDFEQAFQIGPGPNDWDHPIEVKTYPYANENHSGIEDFSHVPEIVERIYDESLSALREKAYTLAGLGFRATIEAICNEQDIQGKSLDTRITNLSRAGLISKKDSERLHSIRFLGNDAAHDIKTPTKRSLQTAQRIIEHLIIIVYILSNEASKSLETIISSFDDFKTLVRDKIKDSQSGTEQTIAAFIGKDRRRLLNLLPEFEQKLMKEINSGEFTELSIGKTTQMQGQRDLQFFITK